MGDMAIQVQNLGKMYKIGGKQEAYSTFRDVLTQAVVGPFQRAGQLLRGEAYGAANLTETIWALKDISFDVKKGEVVGIIGHNGAGKSTLLKILSRITEPTEGDVKLYGRVGALLEVGTGFHNELTGRENVFLNGAILGMHRQDIERKFDEIVDFSGVEKFIDTPVKHYSTGMRLRLGFAVAAHLEPEIFIVDEVLAVGDAEFQKKCLGKMSDVAGEGRTVLFVSHNLPAIKSLCSKTIVLENGLKQFEGDTIEGVSTYLQSNMQSSGVKRWTPEQAPSTPNVRLLEIQLLNDGNEVSDGQILSEKLIQIAITFEVLTDETPIGTSAILYNSDGIGVFVSMSNHEPNWHLQPRSKGLYRSICEIPPNLLADDNYSLTVVLWEGFYEGGINEKEVMHFTVHEQGLVRGDYPHRIIGVIRPKLKWVSEPVKDY